MLAFRDFDQCDWDGFAGCESENPQIVETNGYLLLIDDKMVSMYGGEDWEVNRLSEFKTIDEAKKVANALLDSSQVLPTETWLTLAFAILEDC